MRRNYIRQLKDLGRLPVPPEVMSLGRERLVETVRSYPMAKRSSVWFSAAVFRPLMVTLVVVSVATGGGTFAVASSALPGDKLYVVKIATEDVREYAAFTSERRLLVQAKRASRRLLETEQLLEKKLTDSENRAVLVRETMGLYKGHLFDMNEIAVKIEEGSYDSKNKLQARKAADEIFELHTMLIDSADVAERAVASALIDSIDESLLLENDLLEVTKEEDGDANVGFERHRSERFKKMNTSLKRIHSDLNERKGRDSREKQKESNQKEEKQKN